MPNETKNYGTVITTAGAALIAKCILNGGKVNIKTAAAGDGGGEYYEPTVARPPSGAKSGRAMWPAPQSAPPTPT